MRTYDVSQVSVSFGPILLSGFADDIVSIEPGSDEGVGYVGADGEATWTESADKSAMVRVTLKQSSPSNDLLSAQLLLQKAGGLAQPLTIKDSSGTTLAVCDAAKIKRMPDTGFGKEAGDRTWEFWCGQLVIHVGSNAES